MNMKKRWIPLVIVLLCLMIIPITHMIVGAAAAYPVRILEISDDGTSTLKSQLANVSNFTVRSIRMKEFVAQREELDGRYDAIYIGKGIYSTTGVQGNNHNTTPVMNDITHLKADDIVNSYINKGLPVILHTSILSQTANTSKAPADQRILYDTFSKYNQAASKVSNVFFVDDNGLTALVTQMKNSSSTISSLLMQRPQFTVITAPIDYSVNKTNVYRQGDTINFAFNVDRISDFSSGGVEANLYLGIDKVITMGRDQLVATTSLTQSNGTLQYKLPKAYSGLLYWKLEIVDRQSSGQLKNYTTGIIRYQDEKTVVRVLQVLPSDGTASSLLNTANMTPSYLAGTDYNLNITVKSFSEFNTPAVYSTLNGTYDMLVFGFRDEYNQFAPLTDASATAVQKFIASGQGVMFTHDTIYDKSNTNSNRWLSYFQPSSGQIAPKTNIGLNAVSPSTSTAVVNDGLLTQFPFDLSQAPTNTGGYVGQINLTHDQYYTLNLEDQDVVSWYNIIGSSRDAADSWNHYYTYSKGNVTYSGTGHTNSKFPQWEQKLFVNTLYRAFIGSNHAPYITVNAPTDQSTKPSYLKDFVLSYIPNDLDLKDRNLYASVKFKSGGVYLPDLEISEKTVLSGQSVTETFSNPLPQGGALQIEITVRDKQGAVSTQTTTLNIQQARANLLTDRKIVSGVQNGEIQRNTPLTLQYSVTPQPIDFKTVNAQEQGFSKLLISNIQYTEKLPPNLEIVGNLPEGMTKEGTLVTGYTLKKTLTDIPYSLTTKNNVQSYTPDNPNPLTFSVALTPVSQGTYNLVNAKLDYADIHNAFENIGDLGTAGDYNIFMLGDINMNASGLSTEGRVAGAGTVTLAGGFNIGTKLTSTATGTGVLVAGKNLNLSLAGGTINYGNAVYGGIAFSPLYIKTVKGTPIDFDAAATQLLKKTDRLATVVANGTTKVDSSGAITLTGTDPTTNVFNVSGAAVSKTSSFNINVPAGSTVLVNIDGTVVSMNSGLTLSSGVNPKQVLLNFSGATALNLGNISVPGTVLAPRAAVTFSGDIKGTLIGGSLTGSGRSASLYPFAGDIQVPTPPPTERVTIVFPDIIFSSVARITNLQLPNDTLWVGDQKTLIPIVLPADANNKVLQWKSDNPAVLTVTPTGENGTITAIAPGTARITITATDGSNVSTTATVVVTNPGVSIFGADQIKVGDNTTLQAILVPANPKATVTWSFKNATDKDKATLTPTTLDPWKVVVRGYDSGTVTLVATVTTNGAPSRTYTSEHPILVTRPVEKIAIQGPDTVAVGSTINLQAIISPANADTPKYSWSFESPTSSTLAGITSGTGDTAVITGKQKGTVTVVVNAGGIEVKKQIQVVQPVQGLSIIGANKVNISESIKLQAILTPADADIPDFKWSFADPAQSSYATIIGTGSTAVVTGIQKGTVTVVVSGGGKQAQLDVQVVPVLTGLRLPSEIQIWEGDSMNLNSVLFFTPANVDLTTALQNALQWSTTNTGNITVSKDGIVKGIRKGTAEATVIYTDQASIRATVTIKVLAKNTNGDRY